VVVVLLCANLNIFCLLFLFLSRLAIFRSFTLRVIIIISDGNIEDLSQPIWFSTNSLLILDLLEILSFPLSLFEFWNKIFDVYPNKSTPIKIEDHIHGHKYTQQLIFLFLFQYQAIAAFSIAVELHYLNSRYKTHAIFYLLFFILGISWWEKFVATFYARAL